jgi:NADH dehydrogenase
LLAEARGIDTRSRTVALDQGSVEYDYLVVATGAAHAYFGHDEWRSVAQGLKTLDDALEVRRRVLLAFESAERAGDPRERQRLLTFVIVGGGPTGVELAGALSGVARQALVRDFRVINPAAARVILLEGGPRVLPTFPESLSAAAERSLTQLHVEVRTRATVTKIEPGVVMVGDERIEAETILWAAGVAASRLGRSLGVELDRAGRVTVGQDLTLPSHPEVFVLGDLALAPDAAGHPLPGLAAVAAQQGRHSAMNIRRVVRGEPLRPFHYRNWGNMATIGRAAAVADLGWLRLTGWFGWIAWLFVHLWKLIGFRNRVFVFFEWAWAYFGGDQGVRLITRDDETWKDDVQTSGTNRT